MCTVLDRHGVETRSMATVTPTAGGFKRRGARQGVSRFQSLTSDTYMTEKDGARASVSQCIHNVLLESFAQEVCSKMTE